MVWVCLSDRTLSILHLFSLPSDLEDSPVKYGTSRLSHLLHEKRVGASPPWLTSTSWPSMLITTCQTSTADVLLSWCVCVCVCVCGGVCVYVCVCVCVCVCESSDHSTHLLPQDSKDGPVCDSRCQIISVSGTPLHTLPSTPTPAPQGDVYTPLLYCLITEQRKAGGYFQQYLEQLEDKVGSYKQYLFK